MSKRKLDFIVAIMIFLLSFILLNEMKGIPREGTIFPSYIIYGLIGCAFIMILQVFLPHFKNDIIFVFKEVSLGLWCLFACILIIYVFVTFYLGFFTATFFVCLVVTTVLSRPNWKQSILWNTIFAFSITVFFLLLFRYVFYVPFPQGILF